MIKTLRGIGVPSWVVGLARGVLEAAIFAGALVALEAFTAADSPDWMRLVAPAAVFGWRSIEGTIDHIDPAKKRGE